MVVDTAEVEGEEGRDDTESQNAGGPNTSQGVTLSTTVAVNSDNEVPS